MSVQVGIGHSTTVDSTRAGNAAATEAISAVDQPAFGLVFTSSEHTSEPLLAAINDVLPVPFVGTSTSGEIAGTDSYTESVAVAVLGGDGINVGTAGAAYKPESRPAGRQAANAAIRELGHAPIEAMRVDRVNGDWRPLDAAAGMQFLTHGMDNEAVVEGVADLLGTTTVTGGWAGDDWKDDGSNRVFNGTETYEDGTVLAAMDLDVRSGAGVAHGIDTTTESLTITDGDETQIRELDGREAYDVFYDRFGEKVENAQFLFTQPVSVEIAPGEFRPLLPVDANAATGAIEVDGAPKIAPGRELRLLEPQTEEILSGAADAVDRALARAGDPTDVAAVFLHDCGCRWYHLSDTDTRERELDVVRDRVGADVPIVGWYTAGELTHPDPLSSYHKESLVAWVLTNERL